MKKIIITYCLMLVSVLSFSQYNDSYKCYPQHWWAGMKMNKIQLMIYGDAIRNVGGFAINYPGITITKISFQESYNYAFIDVTIAANTKPGIVKIIPKNFNATSYIQFEIKAREKGNGVSRVQGLTSSDFVYLLMPDRFSNGDTSNDFYRDMNDTQHDRNNPFDRHGGDLQGVQNHLDYINDLGATAIWMTPVTENNMARTLEAGTSRSTYHGYAFTNHFEIDKRLGGNEAYKNLCKKAHSIGLKIIQDAVYNHFGEDHFIIKDLPSKDWLNQWPQYQNTSYRDMPIIDPHAAAIDKKISIDGWFTKFLVDVNQRNQYVQNYLIQYIIWNTEEFGIDGWRVDTYFYNEPSFLNKLNDALFKEYPSIGYFGETLVGQNTAAAYFCKNNMHVSFKHNSKGVTDFPLTLAMLDGFKQEQGWDGGIYKVYQTLAQDFLYKDPMNNCIFLDNHDMDRVFSNFGENIEKMKAAHALLLTQRGIPQIYYGDEILVKNFKDPTDAEVRKDFIGGWQDDVVNKFTVAGRTEKENNFYNYIKKIANFRKTSSALKTGKLMQYIPKDGLYVYFRYDAKQTIMVIINTGKETQEVALKNYEERTDGFVKWKNVLTNEQAVSTTIHINAMQAMILELQK